jgi:hypothetical protein
MFPRGTRPRQSPSARTATGGYLLSCDYFCNGEIFEIDLAQMTLAATIPSLYCGLGSMGVSPNGATLAVASDCQFSNGLMFIDTATASVSQNVANVSGTVIYVSTQGDAYVVDGGIDIVNAKTGSVTAELPGRLIAAAALSPDGHQIYTLSGGASAVEALEEAAPAKLFSIGDPPMWLAASPDGQTLLMPGVSGAC